MNDQDLLLLMERLTMLTHSLDALTREMEIATQKSARFIEVLEEAHDLR